MRPIPKAALAVLASLAIAAPVLAHSGAERVNAVDVALPDGSTLRIHYAGDTPPRVAIAPLAEARLPGGLAPTWSFGRREASPFVWFDRIAAEMDRRMAALMRNMARAMPRGDDRAGLQLVADDEAGAGAIGYSFVSRTISDGACTRTVEMTRTARDAAARVVTRTSGACDGAEAEKPAAATIDTRQTI